MDCLICGPDCPYEDWSLISEDDWVELTPEQRDEYEATDESTLWYRRKGTD